MFAARSWPASIICRRAYNREQQGLHQRGSRPGARIFGDETRGHRQPLHVHDDHCRVVDRADDGFDHGVLAAAAMKGYLEELRSTSSDKARPGLLIFDEVLAGFRPSWLSFCRRTLWRASRHDYVRQRHHLGRGADGRGDQARRASTETFMRGPEHAIELFHGYTYSAHPLACAAGVAARSLSVKRKICSPCLQGARAALCRCSDDAQRDAECPAKRRISSGCATGIDLAAQ